MLRGIATQSDGVLVLPVACVLFLGLFPFPVISILNEIKAEITGNLSTLTLPRFLARSCRQA
jgi:hypothetical protein|tara:strand:+ start:304 stop:489 length:186 start_codon:yes stop_codon:yes gene_type:complete